MTCLQIMQQLNSQELSIAVLQETGRSLSELVAAIPEAFHSAAVHATFPSISSQSTLDLNVGEHTTAAATAALEVFVAVAEPVALHVSNFLLNPAPASTILQAVKDVHESPVLPGGFHAADSGAAHPRCPVSSLSHAAATCATAEQQLGSHPSTSRQPRSTAKVCPKLQRFVTALMHALGCTSLKELSLSSIGFVGNEVAEQVLCAIAQKPQLHTLQLFSVCCIDDSNMADVTCIVPSSCVLSNCSALQRLRVGWNGDDSRTPPAAIYHLDSGMWPQLFYRANSSRFTNQTLHRMHGWLREHTQLTGLCLSNIPSDSHSGPIAALLQPLVHLKSLDVTVSTLDPVVVLGADGAIHRALSCLTMLTHFRLIADAHHLVTPVTQQIVSALQHLSSLEKLDLSSWRMTGDSVREVSTTLTAHLSCLESLSLAFFEAHWEVANYLLAAVFKQQSVTRLSLFSQNMSATDTSLAAFSHYLSRLSHLHSLTLTHQYLVEHLDIADPGLFQQIPAQWPHTEPLLSSLSSLTSLDLSVSFERDVEGKNCLPGLRSLSRLLSLKICGTLLLDESMQNLSAGLSGLSNLESLSIISPECSASGAVYFSRCLSELVSLTYLALAGTFSYEQDIGLAVTLSHLSQLSLLRHLVLDKNIVGPEVSHVLASALPYLHLKDLSMHECRLMFVGVAVLVEGLSQLTNLQSLCVTLRPGMQEDVLLIAPALAQMDLRSLCIGNCTLSDTVLLTLTRALSACKKLTDLHFWQLDTTSENLSDFGWGYLGELFRVSAIRRCNIFKAMSERLAGYAAAVVLRGLSDDDPLRLSELSADYRGSHDS